MDGENLVAVLEMHPVNKHVLDARNLGLNNKPNGIKMNHEILFVLAIAIMHVSQFQEEV